MENLADRYYEYAIILHRKKYFERSESYLKKVIIYLFYIII